MSSPGSSSEPGLESGSDSEVDSVVCPRIPGLIGNMNEIPDFTILLPGRAGKHGIPVFMKQPPEGDGTMINA